MVLMGQYLCLLLHNWILVPKLFDILSLIEEITRIISAEAASISQVIPLVRALTKVLEKEAEYIGVCAMKSKMLD